MNRTAPFGVGTCAVLVGALMAGCGPGPDESGPDGAADGIPTVVATTGIWADVVADVACDGAAEVAALVPPGADPHGFEPSLADRSRLDEADLVVSNGLGLEEGLVDTLQAVEEAGVPVFVVGDHVSTLPADGDAPPDPHIWFDPTRVIEALPSLIAALVDAGADPAVVQRCADAYAAELADVDAAVATTLSTVPPERRKLVTNHDSLAYLADRYDFEVIGTVIPSPSSLAETNPAQIEELAQLIEETDVPAIFAETQHSRSDVDALAARVGDVEVVTLHSGSLGEEGSGADSYVGLLQTDADLIARALG